ncbi:MAG: HAD family phosphatase [Eubacteriales bacterium]|nr:HAD family phosphatase [Eubacteriales bacterium]
MIRTVIFDIGNVLAGYVWRSFFEKQGISGERLERLAKATVQNEDWNEYDRGCTDDEGMLRLFAENDPEIEPLIRSALADFDGLVVPFSYAVPWVKALKEKGYQVLVLSNFSSKALRECWHALDFLPYTDGGILSFREKLIKPMPEIYRLLLDRYCLKPEECVFMDDTARNVEAARAAGIHAFLFENYEQAVRQLAELGVE